MRVCTKHEQAYADDGACPYCEPAPAVAAQPGWHMHCFDNMATMRCSACGKGAAELYGETMAAAFRSFGERVGSPVHWLAEELKP